MQRYPVAWLQIVEPSKALKQTSLYTCPVTQALSLDPLLQESYLRP
jgi:hypothetical protein